MIPIITYCDDQFREVLAITKPLNEKFHDVVLFTPNSFNVPEKYRNWKSQPWPMRLRGRLPFKPLIIRDALNQNIDKFIWLDGDAFAREDLSPVFEQEFDIAVTLRRKDEQESTAYKIQYGYINAGTMFFRNNEMTKSFVDLWALKVEETDSKSDQEALNLLLLECDSMESYGRCFVHKRSGARLLLLSTDVYNFYYFPEPVPDTAKVIHLKTDKRELGMKWLADQSIRAVPVGTGTANDIGIAKS